MCWVSRFESAGWRVPCKTRYLELVLSRSALMPEPIQDLDFRCATESDVEAIADAHRDSILHLGLQSYAQAIVAEWARVVNPGMYVEAIGRGEVFFIATGT